jgi:phosphohistidine phosphatase
MHIALIILKKFYLYLLLKISTMKRLLLMRHTQAEPISGEKQDIDRHITKLGDTIAYVQAEKVKEVGIEPGLIVCSNAQRAVETAQIMAEVLEYTGHIKQEPFLYEDFTTNDFINWLQQNAKDDMVIIGHNPTISTMAFRLTPDFNLSMTPCTGITVTFDVDSWDKIEAGTGKLDEFILA